MKYKIIDFIFLIDLEVFLGVQGVYKGVRDPNNNFLTGQFRVVV